MAKTKKQNVFRVPNVRIGSGVGPVRFKLLTAKQQIKCATRGEKSFIVACDGSKFVCHQRGNDTKVTGPTPAKAFAKGVKEFWALW